MENSGIELKYLLKLSKLETSLKHLKERVADKTNQKSKVNNYLFKIIKKSITEKKLILKNIKIKSYLNCKAQISSSCAYTLGFAGDLSNLDYIVLAIVYIKTRKQDVKLMVSKDYKSGNNQFIDVRKFFSYLKWRFQIKIKFSGGDEFNGYWLLLSSE